MRTISATSFSDYILCPSIYDYKYIQNYQDIFVEKSKDIEKGNIIHTLIDAHSKGLNYPLEYINEDVEIKNAYNYYLQKYSDNDLDTFNEYTFNFLINTDLEKVVLTGRIDKIIFKKSDSTIIDWKTTGKKTKLSLMLSKLQMEFYAFVISKIKNIDSVNAKIVYLNLKEEENIVFEKTDLAKIEKNIFKMIQGTNLKIKNYVPDPIELSPKRYMCEICNFYNFCKDYV